MWTVFYDSSEGARYKITLYADQYLKYIPGPYYSIWIENHQGKCRIGETGEGYAVHYPSGPWDWETYFGKVRVLGWGENVRRGLSDADPQVKEIVNDPAIKSLLTSLLKKYSKTIIQDVFEKFRGSE